MVQISFDKVSKSYGSVMALKELSLEVEDGEFLVLVGPSGCGKSTALRLLAGLEEVSGGRITIGDRIVNNVSAKDRDLAMVFQSYALYPHMSVYDNIAFGLKIRKVPRREIAERVNEAARILGIEELLRRKPRQLSGGQRQRVALGRAIVRQPAAFLLDEPLSNLDAKLRVQTRAELAKLHERLGATFLYVTHDQVEAMTMASRIAVLNEGELQQLGTPQDLYDTPANLFVAGFIGSPAMNFFRAMVTQTDGGYRIDAGAFKLDLATAGGPDLRALVDKETILGIRPEHIHDPMFLSPGVVPAVIETSVDIVEAIGSETYLHLSTDGKQFIARVDARSRAQAGQRFGAALDLSRVYLFDPASDLTVKRLGGPGLAGAGLATPA